jgi:hypothetical protein
MTTTDLIMKSIENLILYGVELDIDEDDADEYLFQMEAFYNERSDDLVATLDIDTLLIDDMEGETICNIFIKDGVLRIIPTSSEYTLSSIVVMLEFITEKNDLFKKKETEEHEEDSDDDFDWI